MRKHHNAGAPAMQREKYHLPQRAEIRLQHSEKSWWQNKYVIIFLVIFLSLLDAATLFTVIDTVMVENEFIGRLMTFGLALCLNFIPLVGGYLIRERYYERSRVPIWSLVVLLATFLLLWGATVYLRAETSALNFSGTESTMVNTVGTQTPVNAQNNEGVSNALTLLLSVMPLVTSIVNLYLGFISDDPVQNRINYLRMRRLELESYRADLLAALNELGEDRLPAMLQFNRMRYTAAVNKTNSRFNGIMSFSRFWLAQVLGDPASISKLSADALVCGVPVEHQMDLDDLQLIAPPVTEDETEGDGNTATSEGSIQDEEMSAMPPVA